MPLSKLISKISNGVVTTLFALLFVLMLPVGSVDAEENNSLRIGGDYKFITMRVGASFRDCQRACENDVSCRAWTFIRERVRKREGINFNLGPDLNIGFGGKREVIPAQCRLKHSVGPKHVNECCVSGVKRVVVRRRPSKAEQCATYAERAIEQQDENLSQRCHLRGPRWDSSYRAHYRWCMDSSSRRAKRETEARDADLLDCRDNVRERRRRDRACDRYASTAMDILEQAKANDCRSSNRDWDTEYERVYEWCLDNRPYKRRRTLENAQAKLAACMRRGGGPLDERCENYAERALAQVRRAKNNQCRVSGPTWANSFKTHYQLCRKRGRRVMRARNVQRANYIDRCIRRGSQAPVMETGFVEVRQRNKRQWHTVRFSKRFRDPVVIMGPVSFRGGDPAHARVRRVTSRGFEFRIEEFGKDGVHVRETLSYMVIEKGVHRFGDTVIEAGTILTGADLVNREWSMVDLSSRWRRIPVVLAQTQTFKGPDPVVARVKGVTRRNFQLSLSEQESDRRGHTRELVAFVAISQGRGSLEGEIDDRTPLWAGRVSRANDRWLRVRFPIRFTEDVPALFSVAQSSNGADTFDVRYRGLGEREVRLRLQEEQSRDRETNHTNEVLGVVVLPHGKYWATSSSRIEDQIADDPVAPPVPPVADDGSLTNCRDYAERAVDQYRRSIRNSCAFTGRTWHVNERRHLRWCRRNGLGAAADELQAHKVRLRRCLARVEEPVEPRGDDVDWQRVGGSLKHVSVGADGTVWGVGPRGKVWARRGGRWREKRGRVKQLDVGDGGEIWAVGNDDRIYRWSGRSWRVVAGRLKQISVGEDGRVWGTNANDRIFYRSGDRWVRVRGRLKQVSVGNRNNIWGVNAANSVFRWTAPGWQRIPGRMKQVSVASNGDVYGLSSSNEIFRWNRRGHRWIKLAGHLKQISAGDGREIWGVNRLNRIYRARVVVGRGRHPHRPMPPVVVEDDDEIEVVDADGWKQLGCQKAGFGRDNDVISVGRRKGRFTAIKFKSSRGKVKFYRATVTFGNGRSQILSGIGKISKNSSTASIDLAGRRRFIDRITMNYKSVMTFPPREAIVCVFGKN